MKRLILILTIFFGVTKLPAQNLVINPGLDSYITCPGFGQFNSTFITSWDKPSIASSDYYNFNCTGIQPAVEMPHSGEGYAGIICYNFGTEYREYITGTFLSPLVAGTIYDVHFYVSLHNGYIQAIEEVGAYISTTAPGPFGNVLHINVVPQIENTTGALNDTSGWKQVSGQFQATGGEQFITIGNFHDDMGTTITQPGTSGSFGAYYFIDDVSVIAVNATSLADPELASEPVINVVNNEMNVSITGLNDWSFPISVSCFNVIGKNLFSGTMTAVSGKFDCADFSPGVYVVVLDDKKGKVFSKKINIIR